jgi:hypothetical protein
MKKTKKKSNGLREAGFSEPAFFYGSGEKANECSQIFSLWACIIPLNKV